MELKLCVCLFIILGIPQLSTWKIVYDIIMNVFDHITVWLCFSEKCEVYTYYKSGVHAV